MIAKVGTRVHVFSPDRKDDWGLGTITKVGPLDIEFPDGHVEQMSNHYPYEITLDSGIVTEGLKCWWGQLRKHTCAMTYRPKIQPVFTGKCHQTIRQGDRFQPGETVTFHTWTGKPYRTPWGQRLVVTLTEVRSIYFCEDHVGIPYLGMDVPWDHPEVTKLAVLDFIDPPTGQTLKNLIKGLDPNSPKKNNKDWEGWYQVIRW